MRRKPHESEEKVKNTRPIRVKLIPANFFPLKQESDERKKITIQRFQNKIIGDKTRFFDYILRSQTALDQFEANKHFSSNIWIRSCIGSDGTDKKATS